MMKQSSGTPKDFSGYVKDTSKMSEKAVEIDHLKTLLVAFKEKTQIVDDIQNELSTKSQQLVANEDGRVDLQNQIRELIKKAEEDAKTNQEFQSSLQQKNQDLQDEIAKQRGDIDTLKTEKADREADIDAQNSTILQLKNFIIRIEQELEVRKDVEKELADSRSH